MTGFNISIPEGNNMKAFQIDGGNSIIPTTAFDVGIIYPGERIDIIISHLGAGDLSITFDPEYESQPFISFNTNLSIDFLPCRIQH